MEEYSVRRRRQDCEMDVRSCCGRRNRTAMSISAGRERNLDVMYRTFLGRRVWNSIADYKTCGEDGLIE